MYNVRPKKGDVVSFMLKNYLVVLLFYTGSTALCIHANVHNSKDLAREYAALALERSREKKIDEAIRLYKKSIELNHDCAETHFILANHLYNQKRTDEAVKHYTIAAALQPTCAEIHCNLGICANRMEKYEVAITHFRNAIQADDTCSIAHLQLALTLEKLNQLDEALIHFDKAIHLRPGDIDILSHLGNTLKKLERFDEAIIYYRKAHALKPNDINTMLELANVLNTVDQTVEALSLYNKVLQIKPELYNVLYNFGFTLKKLGFIQQAIDVHKKVLEYDNNYAHAHFSLGISYLTLGKFEQGWPEYEWRWAAYKEKPREFKQPRWKGEDLQGKRIFVYAEQGYGDTFQFIRYLLLLKNMGAYVIFNSQIALKTFLKSCPYIDQVITYSDTIPNFDFHIPLMSLPLIFDTTLETIPATIPYLYAQDHLIAEWKDKLSSGTFKIGLCWQGNSKYQTAPLRRTVAAKSLHVKHFSKLANIPGVTFYSLQKINGVDQIDELEDSSFLHTFDADLDTKNGSFVDTAAIIKNLDLVITIDTSIGHFAAALGTPTWILLPDPADWRWMLDRTDTPWYPNVRLFRQMKAGDWDSVINAVLLALQEHLNVQQPSIFFDTETHIETLATRIANYINTLHETQNNYAPADLVTAYALQKDIEIYLEKQKGN